MSVNEKLKKLAAKSPGDWLAETEEEFTRSGARANARKVSLSVLRFLREQQITQTALAERMGVSRQHVAKIVKGKENFTFETIEKLEKALGITLMTIPGPAGNYPEHAPAVLSSMIIPITHVANTLKDRSGLTIYDNDNVNASNVIRMRKTVGLLQSMQIGAIGWCTAGSVKKETRSIFSPLASNYLDIHMNFQMWSFTLIKEKKKEEPLVADSSIYSMS